MEQGINKHSRHSGLEPFRDESRTRVLRFWLNVIFMVGVVVGIIVYYRYSQHTSMIILIVASVFKFIELALRILKI